MADATPMPRALAWAVFWFVLAVNFFSYSGKLDNSIDGREMIAVTHNLLDRLSPIVVRAGGEGFSKYGLGLSLVYLPLDMLGKLAAAALPVSAPKAFWAREFVMGLTHPLLGALASAGLVLLLASHGLDRRRAVAGALLATFTTPLWVYAKADFAESLQACGMIWLFVLTGPLAARQPGRSAWWAGWLVGLLFLSKVTVVIAAPVVAAYALALRRWRWRWRWRELAPALAGPLACLLVFLAYNHWRFGSPFETGYGAEAKAFTAPLMQGVYGMTLFPTKSVFWFAPLLGLLPLWLPPRWRKAWGGGAWPLAVAGMALMVVFVGFYARWHSWNGGLAFGPRFVVPVMPLAAAAACPVVFGLWRGGLVARALVVGLCLFGVVNQVPGVAMKLNTTYDHGLGETCVQDRLGIKPFDHKTQWAVRCWPPAQVTQGARMFQRLPRLFHHAVDTLAGRPVPQKPRHTALDFWWAYLLLMGKKGVLAGVGALLFCGLLVLWRGWTLCRKLL